MLKRLCARRFFALSAKTAARADALQFMALRPKASCALRIADWNIQWGRGADGRVEFVFFAANLRARMVVGEADQQPRSSDHQPMWLEPR
jgi:endonuclease/exonuclease/phosphatase family metal-dependent hydrolase